MSGMGAAGVGEEDAAVGGQGGRKVCGGRAKDGEERGRRLAALWSAVEGARPSWIHGGGEEQRQRTCGQAVK